MFLEPKDFRIRRFHKKRIDFIKSQIHNWQTFGKHRLKFKTIAPIIEKIIVLRGVEMKLKKPSP